MKRISSFPLWSQILFLVVGWRLVLTGIVYWAQQLPYRPSFSYLDSDLPTYGSRFITTWAQFDGVHYLTIITKGYMGAALIQAFFPFYPLVVRMLSFFFGNPVWVGMSFPTLCFGIGLWWLYKLVLLDESEVVARRVLWLILLAPTVFFFTAVYTESLFFMLLVWCFYCARKKKWWLAGTIGIFLTATRLVGIFIVPALLYEYWYQQQLRGKVKAISTMIPCLGIGAYMVYLKQVFHDPLLFYHVQADFGAQRETNRIITLFQVFYRYIKMFLTIPISERLFYVIAQEFLSGLIGIVSLIIGWFVVRPAYVIFALLAYITPTLTGSFLSMPRFLLPLFPLYMVVAKVLPKWAYIMVLIGSAIVLTINLINFTQGLWVA